MTRYRLGLALVMGSLLAVPCFAAQTESTLSMLPADAVAGQIHLGMTRAEVETILTNRDRGPQSIHSWFGSRGTL